MLLPCMSWKTFLRRLLPWMVSAAALAYVFGYAIDWKAIPEATARANLPLFVAITVVDKIVFFLFWGVLQAGMIRRFVEPVSVRRVIEVKGGAELLRTVNNSLADAAFLFGVSQLARGRMAAVMTVASIPFGCHFAVLLVQATLTLPLATGGIQNHAGVATIVAVCWALVGCAALAVRLGYWRRLLRALGVSTWLRSVRAREIVPFVGWFGVFALFDVVIQGFASRAFGVPIPWLDLAVGIPVLYFSISIPSLGNFGTREIAWANLFADFGSRESLIAFALWTNVVFLVMHLLIGTVFASRAMTLLREMRRARREGASIPEPMLRDAIDP
jgi:hypothetical protein